MGLESVAFIRIRRFVQVGCYLYKRCKVKKNALRFQNESQIVKEKKESWKSILHFFFFKGILSGNKTSSKGT